MFRRALTLLALAALPAHAAAQTADVYSIPSPAARCLLKNEARYAGSPDELLIIYVALCPTLKPSPLDLASAASNSVITKNPASTTIVIERSRVRCLIGKIRDQENLLSSRPSITVDARKC